MKRTLLALGAVCFFALLFATRAHAQGASRSLGGGNSPTLINLQPERGATLESAAPPAVPYDQFRLSIPGRSADAMSVVLFPRHLVCQVLTRNKGNGDRMLVAGRTVAGELELLAQLVPQANNELGTVLYRGTTASVEQQTSPAQPSVEYDEASGLWLSARVRLTLPPGYVLGYVIAFRTESDGEVGIRIYAVESANPAQANGDREGPPKRVP